MPAAMESSQNIENPLEISIFSLNFFENVFFSWKSRKISPDLENLLRDLAGRARNLSARPKSSKSHHPEKIGSVKIFYRQIFFGGMEAFEVADSGCS